ncbi:MAG TPA: ATP-binding protein [Deltaproteobacteria bacterium]|nr:ATP-binding protein [Deltaproteobacteria bacterium]
MMEDISSHIMDIVMNSVTAEAKHISVVIEKDPRTSILGLTIADDGVGMDSETAQKVQDPFFSTKTGRKVGLGIPLLKGTAETTGGSFELTSARGAGTTIRATFDSRHPDLPPMGNVRDTFFVLIVSHPDVDFNFHYFVDGKNFTLDTGELKRELDGVPVNHPEVISFLSKYLDEHL